jgi:hypothetical protein
VTDRAERDPKRSEEGHSDMQHTQKDSGIKKGFEHPHAKFEHQGQDCEGLEQQTEPVSAGVPPK